MRTIESPGVEINEIDQSLNTDLPNGTTSLVVGYAKQGPTNELINATSIDELELIYGTPENSAERYFYQTAKQVLEANGNLLVTRLPYGSGDGSGYTTKYSALVYPYIPVDVVNPCTTYTAVSSDTLSGLGLYTLTAADSGVIVTTETVKVIEAAAAVDAVCVDTVSSQAFNFTGVFTDGAGTSVSGTVAFNTDGSVVVDGSTSPILSSLGAVNWTGLFTAVNLTSAQIYQGETAPIETYAITLSTDDTLAGFVSGTISTDVTYQTLTGGDVTSSNASHYYIGQPTHIPLDEATYFNWQQGGINWKSTITSDASGIISNDDDVVKANVGYSAMVVVNKVKTTISENFEGYYIAIADNSKLDKGSNFDSLSETKSFNQYTSANEWISLNTDTLAYSMTGSYYEHAGSVSEIVESAPDFNFSDAGIGGYGDSIVLSLFKVRPTIYNQDTRVLDKVLYETHIGSFDSTRRIQNETGGTSENFYLEDIVNDNSNNLKMFINPYISKFSGNWSDPQTHEPTKLVRVVCGERDVIGSESDDIIGTVQAEPAAIGKAVFDKVNELNGSLIQKADNLYGVGEAIPCNATLQKSIGNLPRKLEKALRLAENVEQLRVDLVPEGGLGTVWTGMNLDMSNWPEGTFTRTGSTRIKETFDDTVYTNGIITKHTFDTDSNGLLDQDSGSSSEASDLYETIANIFNQYCQYTRKDCLYIADPLRYIFVQGNGDVKVMDDDTLNFSQHISWPLRNLFGGLNSSYSCTYANWFKINDNVGDNLVWAPPSGYAANLMIKTDTNFFPWYAPAGLTRGILSGIVDIAINPTQKHRDLLYKNGINSTVYWPGDGYVVWGQKTLLSKPSAFNRINVRRLFLWAEKAVLPISRYFVFEQNTSFTRNRFKSAIDPVLSFARSNEGIYDYEIVCDERNNPSEVIDRNELVMDIYIKPVRVAEFILINFVATRTGQDFDELI